MKNMVNNYSEAEIKVREATSNDPWGPPSSLMSEISDLTFNVVAFTEVMGMIWKRLNDHGKNWRHVYKALTLLDYLIKTGSERVAQQCRENIFTIQTLRDFQFTDRDGRDQGVNVREKAKQLVTLMRDDDKLKQERTQALKTKERMAGAAAGMGSGSLPPPYPGRRTSQPSMAALYGDEFGRSRGSPSSFNCEWHLAVTIHTHRHVIYDRTHTHSFAGSFRDFLCIHMSYLNISSSVISMSCYSNISLILLLVIRHPSQLLFHFVLYLSYL